MLESSGRLKWFGSAFFLAAPGVIVVNTGYATAQNSQPADKPSVVSIKAEASQLLATLNSRLCDIHMSMSALLRSIAPMLLLAPTEMTRCQTPWRLRHSCSVSALS
jgi:hypothetical protein